VTGLVLVLLGTGLGLRLGLLLLLLLSTTGGGGVLLIIIYDLLYSFLSFLFFLSFFLDKFSILFVDRRSSVVFSLFVVRAVRTLYDPKNKMYRVNDLGTVSTFLSILPQADLN